jgi:hypothetical protein
MLNSAGLSPAALAEACFDWLVHLAVTHPQVVEKASKKTTKLAVYSALVQRTADNFCAPRAVIKPRPNQKEIDQCPSSRLLRCRSPRHRQVRLTFQYVPTALSPLRSNMPSTLRSAAFCSGT